MAEEARRPSFRYFKTAIIPPIGPESPVFDIACFLRDTIAWAERLEALIVMNYRRDVPFNQRADEYGAVLREIERCAD